MCVFEIILLFQMIITHVPNMEFKYLNTFLIPLFGHTGSLTSALRNNA